MSTQKRAKDPQMSPDHQDTIFHAGYSREANWHFSQGSTWNQLDKNCFPVHLSSLAVLTPHCQRLPGEESASQTLMDLTRELMLELLLERLIYQHGKSFSVAYEEVSNQLGTEIQRNRLTWAINCWGSQSTCFCNRTLTNCVFTRKFKLESSSMDLVLILKKKRSITANLFLSKW